MLSRWRLISVKSERRVPCIQAVIASLARGFRPGGWCRVNKALAC